MAVTGSITTRFIDEKGVDLGKTLIEKDYLISVYPNIVNQMDTPMLMTWGKNAYGELGDNTIVTKSSPVQTIAYGANWKQISAGGQHTAAIKTDGTLWTWGNNYYGQLGDNTSYNSSKSSPVQTIARGTNWKQVSCGYGHAAAIKTDGTLWTWGQNYYGGLGDNTIIMKSSPVQTIAGGTNWKQVSCGPFDAHTAAIKTDGTLWCWGYNAYGKLGDNTTTNRSSPIQTIAFGTNWKQVSCGSGHTAAIKTDGTLWTWGAGGSLGDNTILSRSSPVQTITFATNWKQVSCGFSNYTAAIKTDGTLWTWGSNYAGRLGDNTTDGRSSPVQTITRGTNWKQVAASNSITAAIKTDGTLWCWGRNNLGQLGGNTTTDRSSPVQTILYGQNWKSVACGAYHTAAIKDGDF
jgi:alpha-tubulin suppressor-like RCC1 family protein